MMRGESAYSGQRRSRACGAGSNPGANTRRCRTMLLLERDCDRNECVRGDVEPLREGYTTRTPATVNPNTVSNRDGGDVAHRGVHSYAVPQQP
jgi:hypothetical protein